MDFDPYADSYREAVEHAVSFAGAEPDRYTRAKAALLVELAERELGEAGSTRALDVGCGVGETDRFLRGTFASLHGVDISRPMVERAAERNPWASYSHYREGAPLPFDDGSFDLTFAICVLHHVPPSERRSFASELARVTRPGGLVALFEHNPWNPLTRKAVNRCAFDEDAVLVSRRRARRLLDESGLDQVRSAYIIFFPGEGGLRNAAERALAPVALGAQYLLAHRKPPTRGAQPETFGSVSK